MKTYTRDQLVTAMMWYNQKSLTEAENFSPVTPDKECAERQVDYMLGLIEYEEPA